MEQRTLRLGDIVDDYCPRERRVTNHAIVAIVENTIRQTRCSTCDAEHEYKEAKVPLKKKPKAGESDLAGGVLVTPKAATNGAASDNPESAAIRPEEAAPIAASSNGAQSSQPPAEDEAALVEDEDKEPVIFTHRPLIRASLPKTDSDPPPQRAIPEFTMHQRHGRGFGGGGGGRGGFRHGHGFHSNGSQPFRSHQNNNNGNGNEPDGNRDPQSGRPPGGPGGHGGPGGGGGRRRRRRRR